MQDTNIFYIPSQGVPSNQFTLRTEQWTNYQKYQSPPGSSFKFILYL